MANLNPLNPLKAPLMATAGHQKSKGRGGPQRASTILESVGLQHDMVEACTKRIKLGDKTKWHRLSCVRARRRKMPSVPFPRMPCWVTRQSMLMVLLRPHRCHEPGDTVSMLKWQTADQHLNTVSWVAQSLSHASVEPVAPSRRADSRQSKRRRTQSEGKQSRQTQPHGFAANQKGTHR